MLGVLAAALAWNARADDQQKAAEANAELKEKEAEAAKDVSKAKAEANKDVAETQAKAEKDVAETQAKANEKVGEAKQEANEEKREAAQQGTASGTEQKDPSADPSRAAASGDMGRTSMGGDVGHKHPVFTKDNWDVKGTIQSVTKTSIIVRREELPAAKLNIDKYTKIELDGDHATTALLKPGQEVKASFNLRNDKPMAVEIKADKKE
jgi:vacuolar-type H+-ATPase subunit H